MPRKKFKTFFEQILQLKSDEKDAKLFNQSAIEGIELMPVNERMVFTKRYCLNL